MTFGDMRNLRFACHGIYLGAGLFVRGIWQLERIRLVLLPGTGDGNRLV